MMKMISVAAIAFAMTAGIASAQTTTGLQAGAGLFDQGGDFGPHDTTQRTYQSSTDGIDHGSTASIDSGMDVVRGNDARGYDTPRRAENTVVPSGSTFGGSSILFDNSK